MSVPHSLNKPRSVTEMHSVPLSAWLERLLRAVTSSMLEEM